MCRIDSAYLESGDEDICPSCCAGIRFFCVRQNLLSDAAWVQALHCKSTLEELHLNDNQLKAIPELQSFTALVRLELSYNHEARPVLSTAVLGRFVGCSFVKLALDLLHGGKPSALLLCRSDHCSPSRSWLRQICGSSTAL
jgi:hypothetical protein